MKGLQILQGDKKKVRKNTNPYRNILVDLGNDNLECGFEATSHSDSCEEIFLNRFDEREIFSILEEIGLRECLRDRGFSKLELDIAKDDAGRHHLSIFHTKIKNENLLINLRLSESIYRPEISLPFHMKRGTYNMINVEWAQASNPKNMNNRKKPLLPGQEKPGLGILSYLFHMMEVMGRRVSSDGFMEVPDHFHLAAMYSGKFRFFDPEKEALLRGVLRDLSTSGIGDLSWGFITGTIREENSGSSVEYIPGTQIHPLNGDLAGYYNSSWYQKKFNRAMASTKYSLDTENMHARREEILKKQSIGEV